MNWTILRLINIIFDIFTTLIFIEVIGSWIMAPRIKLPEFVYTILQAVHSITSVVLDPIRKVIPAMGGLDISPIIALLLMQLLQGLLTRVLLS